MRKMKESGIEWIGDIPENWETRRLKFFAEISSGEYMPSIEYVCDGSYPIIGSNGEIGRTNKLNNTEKVIVTGRVGTIGSVMLVNKAWITDNTLIIDPVNICLDYLFYLITCFDFQTMLTNTAQPLITATKLKNKHIPIPPKGEAKIIASFLSEKCEKIEQINKKQKKLIERLKDYKQALITETVTKGLDPDVEMKDSGADWIGELPKHWELTRIKNECISLNHLRKPLSAEQRKSDLGLYDYYGASGVIDKIDEYNVDDTVLLIGEDGANLLLRNLPLVYKAEGKFWVNNHAHILKVKANNDYTYFSYLLEAGDYAPYISGSAQPKLTKSNLMSFLIVRPPLTEQIKIGRYLNNRCTQIEKIIGLKQKIIDKLEAYKKSLIYEVVTGKKEV